MNIEIFSNFLFNILLLMSMSVVYSVFKSDSFFHPIIRKILMGVLVGVIVGFIMWNSYILAEVDEGIMFDTRAVLLSVSGMFFGLIPTLIGMTVAIIVRISHGGIGMVTGIFWILASSAIGLLWRKYRLKRHESNILKINWIELYLFGLLVQIVMILLLFTLPNSVALDTINQVAFPLLVVYPFGSLFVSQFLLILRKQYFNDLTTIQSERQYRKLFTHNKTNLMLVNSFTGEIADANEACVDTYGYTVEELKKMTISQINSLPHEDVMYDFIAAREDKKTYFQYQHIKKSGVLFDVEIHTSKITIKNKEYIYMTSIDISEKVQSERMFKDADERLRTTLLSVGEGIVVTDEYARITLINQKALNLIGKSGSLQRKKLFDEFRIYSNQSKDDFETLYSRCMNENITFRSDNTYSLITNPNDSIIFVDFTISPINNEYGVNHGAILVLRDVSIEKERQEEIRFMSKHDYLTRLYNRYNFETEILRLDTKRQLPVSLIIGDINGLKLVNDAFGHLEGDKLIKEVADIFKKSTRTEDIVARWGGDEFAILLPQTDKIGAISVVNRIKDLCEKSMYNIITPSVSVGIATKTIIEQDIKEVLTSAEEQMYNNKLVEGPVMREQLLTHLLKMLNEKVADNKSHSENMIVMMEKYFKYYNITGKEVKDYALLARYHDVGRIGIDEGILNKIPPLSNHEWTRIRVHPEIGSRLVATIPELQHLATPILQHHERYDGTGYPQGIKGEAINVNARLLSIFESYETITNNRVYKSAKSHDEAINEILKNTGKQFDPVLVNKFIKVFK